tara:strand:+ start:1259 stop:1438 length:180 start_codon:yes stop_codon:yes gene_type:complete
MNEITTECRVGNTIVKIQMDEDKSLGEVICVVYNALQGIGYTTKTVDKYLCIEGIENEC